MGKLSFKNSADGGKEGAKSIKKTCSLKNKTGSAGLDTIWRRLPSNSLLESVIKDTLLSNRIKDSEQIDEARKRYFALTQSRRAGADVRLMSEFISSREAEEQYERMVSSLKPKNEEHVRLNEAFNQKSKTRRRNKRKRQNRKASFSAIFSILLFVRFINDIMCYFSALQFLYFALWDF